MGKNHIFRLSGIATGAVLSTSLLLAIGSSGYINPSLAVEPESSSIASSPNEQNKDSDLAKELQEPQAAPVESSPAPVAQDSSTMAPAEVIMNTVVAVDEPVSPEPVAPVVETPVELIEPAPVPVVPAPTPAAPKPVEAPRVPVAPAPVPVAVQPPAPAYDRSIYVGASGGQETVDRCIGPVLFPIPDPNIPVYVAEHDGCGGWQRIGTLGTGYRVHMSGLVSGDYTVREIVTVKKGAMSNQIGFSKRHSVVLQTCIPGTNSMVVVGMD